MKRLLIILFAIVLLAGCQKDAPVDASVTMTYSVKPPVQFITKAAGEGSRINILWCGVYHKKAEGYEYMLDMSTFVEVTPGQDINVPLTLIRNQEYMLVFVAQHRGDTNLRTTGYTYNIKYDTGEMELNAPLTDGECLDVFVKVDHVRHVTGNEHRDITLDRPVAQVNIGTSAAELPTSFGLTLTGVPASYNLFTGTHSQSTVEHTFQGLTPPAGGTLSVGEATYKHMTTLYIFGGNKIGGSITYGQSAKTFSNIDTAPNHKTNIVGNI